MSIYKGIVTNGTVKVFGNISHLEGREVEVGLKAWKANRSSQQNRLLHGVVIPAVIQVIEDTQGIRVTKGMAEEFCKRSFLGVERIQGIEVARSSRSLNVQEFNDYIKRISDWVWQFGNVVIPLHSQEE